MSGDLLFSVDRHLVMEYRAEIFKTVINNQGKTYSIVFYKHILLTKPLLSKHQNTCVFGLFWLFVCCFLCPRNEIRGHLVFVLSVILSVTLSVTLSLCVKTLTLAITFEP